MSYNILIAESEPNLLRLYQMILCEAGYQVHPAHNAQELLKHLESTPVDLIVIGFDHNCTGEQFITNKKCLGEQL